MSDLFLGDSYGDAFEHLSLINLNTIYWGIENAIATLDLRRRLLLLREVIFVT